MSIELLNMSCDNYYKDINSLLPDYHFLSNLVEEIKKVEEGTLREPTNQELADHTLSRFHTLYKHTPDFQKYKTLRRKGQKSENTNTRRKLDKIKQLKKEIRDLEDEIQKYKEWLGIVI